jgi:hypothetical protein
MKVYCRVCGKPITIVMPAGKPDTIKESCPCGASNRTITKNDKDDE